MNDRIVLSAEAIDGMESTVSYIAERNPVAAEQVRVAILATLDSTRHARVHSTPRGGAPREARAGR